MYIDDIKQDNFMIPTTCPYCGKENEYPAGCWLYQLAAYEQTCKGCEKVYTVELPMVKKIVVKEGAFKRDNDNYN